MIPKKIHYSWYGNGEYSDVIKKCMASWSEKLPDYEMKKWDETNTPFDKLSFLNYSVDKRKCSLFVDFV